MYHFKKIWFCIVGIICIGMSIRCFTFRESRYVPLKDYGKYLWEENAYEGIQNATAIAAGNISALSEFEHFGFGSAFLVAGLAFLGGQLPKKNLSDQKDVENPFDDNVELD